MTADPSAMPRGDQLTGQLLVAMPTLRDPNFARTVVFMCSHSEEGAFGIVVNRPVESPVFHELLHDLNIDARSQPSGVKVRVGGPVEQRRGFVLHTDDCQYEASLVVGTPFVLTASVDVLRAIADGSGPRQALVALGCAGWGPGQLEGELLQNAWLNVEATEETVFGTDDEGKWEHAIGTIGSAQLDPSRLSPQAGNA